MPNFVLYTVIAAAIMLPILAIATYRDTRRTIAIVNGNLAESIAGVRVSRNGMVGASALATKDVRPYHVNVGIPAKSVRVKPNAPADSYVTERVSRRPGESSS